ncbi:hypothetical protein JOM56_006857 [Amanita muscaria]
MGPSCPSSSSSPSPSTCPVHLELPDQPSQTASISHPQATKVEDLWFEDGGVIIQAGLSLYRVSRGILAARSNVFKHMFQSCVVPRPVPCACPSSGSTAELAHDGLNTQTKQDVTEMVDGVPFLKLLDDERDVTEFLKAVFDSSFFEPDPCGKPSIAAVIGILRLSHKYDIGYLRKRALNYLNQGYPNTLARWDMHNRGELAVGYERVHDELLEAYIVIQLALETQADWLIPAAMYKCCTYPIENILALESAIAQAGFNAPYFTAVTAATGISAAQQLCLTTWPKIRASYHTLYGHLRTSACTDWPRCQTRLSDKTAVYSRVASAWDTMNDPLDSLDSKYWSSLKRDLCRNCCMESTRFYEKWRKDLWAELPKLMGLKEWEVLNKMAEEQP